MAKKSLIVRFFEHSNKASPFVRFGELFCFDETNQLYYLQHNTDYVVSNRAILPHNLRQLFERSNRKKLRKLSLNLAGQRRTQKIHALPLWTDAI